MTHANTHAGPTLRRNILATYASQAWVTLAGILFVPIYLRFLGSEAYGLVGFFAVLQVSFGLLDLGLTRTISRETARFHADPRPTAALEYRRLVRAMQMLFLGIAVVGSLILVALANPIAGHWLRSQTLTIPELRFALQAMGVTVGLRWAGGLYRGIIVGSERIAWIAGFNAAIATARFVGVVPVLALVAATPAVFFTYQLAVAAIEFAGLAVTAHRTLPHPTTPPPLGWSLAAVRPVLGFSAGIAVTSIIWILVTQTDKLILSRLLLLAEYGHFTLGVLVAGGVLMATAPIATPLLPRLARMEAEGHHTQLLSLYRVSTQLVCVLAFALAATLAAFARQILWAWTGDADASSDAAPVLALYAVGNAVLAIAAFPFYLQYAKGDLRLHVWGSIGFLVVLIPSLVTATLTFGTQGAAWTWLGANVLFLVAWVPVVHRRFTPGLHGPWLSRDVLPIVLATAVTAAAAMLLAPQVESRLASAAVAMAGGILVLAAALVASGATREQLTTAWRRLNRTRIQTRP
ncbi:MAG: oligosaccharide flippase family protein [Candidatus Thermoplasmatota archaeon]|jgi:O-antigen/teichoic acid export membrane protein